MSNYYSEDEDGSTEEKRDKIEDTWKKIRQQLERENIANQIDKRSGDYSQKERRKMGDHVFELLMEYSPSYSAIILPTESHSEEKDIMEDGVVHTDDDELTEKTLYLFPYQKYKDSLMMLESILSKGCLCEEEHPRMEVINQPYLTHVETDILSHSSIGGKKYSICYDHILVSPSTLKRLSEEPTLKCLEKYFIDSSTRHNVIDWIDTGERLGWVDPPEERSNFIEGMRLSDGEDTKITFTDGDTPATLLDIFENWLKQNCRKEGVQMDERQQMSIIGTGMDIVRKLGTTDGLFEMRTTDPENGQMVYFYVPFDANSESIKILSDALKQEHDNVPKDFFDERKYITVQEMIEGNKCRCGLSHVDHKCYFNMKWPKTLPRMHFFVMLEHMDQEHKDNLILMEDGKMLPPTRIQELLSTCGCPHNLIKDKEAVMKLFS